MIDEKKKRNLIIGTAWELMLFTGLRDKNARELRWSDLELDNALLHVAELKNGTWGSPLKVVHQLG